MSAADFLETLLDGAEVVWKPLGKIATVQRGASPRPISKFITDGENGVPWIKIGDTLPGSKYVTRTAEKITPEGAEHSRRLSKGDFIVSNSMSFGRPYILAIDGAIHDGWAAISDFSGTLHPDFLYHYLSSHSVQNYWLTKINSGSVSNLNSQLIQTLPVPIPCPDDPEKSLAIQAEIVRMLDSFSELTAELTAGLAAELTARNQQYNYYRDQLLNFDEEAVEWQTLEEIAYFHNAKPHERLVSTDGDVALLTARFISTQGKSARFVRKADVLTPAFVNDVALVMSDLPNGRALARTFFVDESGRYAANQRVCLFRLKEPTAFSPKFLHHVMNRNKRLLEYDNGSDQTHLKKDWILNVRIPVPPLFEQNRIVAILDKFDALTASLNEVLPREIELREKQYAYYRDQVLKFPKPEDEAA